MSAEMISVMSLRKRLGAILNRVHYANERFIIERKGKSVAALIGIDELRRLERMEAERDAELLRMAKAASEGTVSFEALVAQYEDLYGEPLTANE